MVFQKLKRAGRYARHASRAFVRDARNRLVHGDKAPLYAERIWVNPQDCVGCLLGLGNRFSGRVVTSAWPPGGGRLKRVEDLEKIRCCVTHWSEGVPWEKTGIFQLIERKIAMSPKRCYDDCRNHQDIVNRYSRLDAIFETVSREGTLRTNKEIVPWVFREKEGVLFHLGPGGTLFFGGSGCHRFAMALVLGLTVIPAKTGCVHISAVPSLGKFREKRFVSR